MEFWELILDLVLLVMNPSSLVLRQTSAVVKKSHKMCVDSIFFLFRLSLEPWAQEIAAVLKELSKLLKHQGVKLK